jgi:hypothetical protein
MSNVSARGLGASTLAAIFPAFCPPRPHTAMTFYVVAGKATATNVALVSAIRKQGIEAAHQ